MLPVCPWQELLDYCEAEPLGGFSLRRPLTRAWCGGGIALSHQRAGSSTVSAGGTAHARGGDTRDTRTHKGTRTTQTNLTTIQTHQQHTPRTSARRPKPRPTQQPQAQSRPLPAADSEEATPSKPDPASTRSQSASPRLLESGRRNEGACGRRVAAGSAAGAPDKLKTREAEAGMRNGRGEADLGAQGRDHEGGCHAVAWLA